MINDELIKEYEQYLSLAGYAKNSIRTYLFTIRQFCYGKKIEEVNSKNFFSEFKLLNLSPATISSRIKIFKQFLRFLSEERGVSIINIFSIKQKLASPLAPEYLELSEIEELRKSPLDTIYNLRKRALFEFLLFTGCRISECVNADWNEIDFEKNELLITGKYNKKRLVFLGGSTYWIKRYLRERGDTFSPLFINQFNGRLGVADVQRPFRSWGKEVGLKKDLHPHMLRATFATHMIRAGVEPRTLQMMLGHENVNTTLRHYIGVSLDYMKTQHEAFSVSLMA